MGEWLQAGAIGLLSGALSGAFGIGGGIITTPAIRLLMGAPALIAVGTPLPVIVPGALTGALSYRKEGLIDVRAGLLIALGGIPFTVVGAWLTSVLGGTVVLVGTAALIIWAATDMLLQAMGHVPKSPESGSHASHEALYPKPSWWACVSIGALTGLYSGFLGLGGGFVIVPLLTRWMRMPIKIAIGTSLLTVAVLAVPGTISHHVLGHIDWRIALGLVLGVVPGAALGARLSMRSADRTIRIAFAGLLIVVGLWLGLSELGLVKL